MHMIPVNRKFLRGDIYYANLEPHLGSEQGGIRPVVVVQNNTANCYSPNLIVAPVTSNTAVKEYKDVRQQCVLPSAEWWSAIVSGWHPDSFCSPL